MTLTFDLGHWSFMAGRVVNFYGCKITFKGRLLLAPPMLKWFSSENFSVSLKLGPKMAVLRGKGFKCYILPL